MKLIPTVPARSQANPRRRFGSKSPRQPECRGVPAPAAGDMGRRGPRSEGRVVVAMVSDAIYPYHHGGKELRYYELSRRLADRADVHVYTMKWWQGLPLCRHGNVTYKALCRYYPLYVGERRSIIQAVFFALACLRLMTARFDVIEADHMPYLQIPVLWLVATIRRKPLVVTWHEVWGLRYWQQYLGRAGMAAWMIEWLAMRLPDHIVAASPQTAQRLRETLGPRTRITVAPNGIDLTAIHLAPVAKREADLVTVGRHISHKRIDMLLDAVALLRSDGFAVTCRVIGNGPDRDRLRMHARALGLAETVEFLDDVRDQGELYGLLKSAKVFVSPSAREGFGIAVLEAIACGLPVVTTSTPDNLAQYIAAKSTRGVVCDPDAESLADTLKGLLRNCDASASQDDWAEDSWLDEYTWDACASVVAQALMIPPTQNAAENSAWHRA